MNKILIIDDELDKQKMLTEYFESKNCCVKIANCVNEALEVLLTEEKFELLILDMHLPENKDSIANMMGGLEIAKFLYINNSDFPYLVFTQYEEFSTEMDSNRILESKYYEPAKLSNSFYQDIKNIAELNAFLSDLSEKYLGAILCCYTDDYWIKYIDALLRTL
ncbi:response regulator [[Eubacterium] hominis]|uniref:response regulator n=1 Tax=[Eubacterium] hominis TaxID=2764325 RepID=UPI003A4DA28E